LLKKLLLKNQLQKKLLLRKKPRQKSQLLKKHLQRKHLQKTLSNLHKASKEPLIERLFLILDFVVAFAASTAFSIISGRRSCL
jgi:hypothetical protein